MAKLRIEIIKDELNQRCEEITSFEITKDDWIHYPNQRDDFLKRVSEYVYFIKSTPELNYHYLEILEYYKNKFESIEVKILLSQASESIIKIGKSIVKHTEYIKHKDDDILNETKWGNPFEKSVDSLSANELIHKLTEPVELKISPIEVLESVIQIMQGDELRENSLLYQISEPLYRDIQPHVKPLLGILPKLRKELQYEPDYIGYDEVIELEEAFQHIYPIKDIIPGEMYKLSVKYQAFREIDHLRIQHAAKRVNRILVRKLLGLQNRAVIIQKLKAYMEWFYRLKDTKRRMSENQLANEVAKFIFPQGYFPFIRFKAGRKEPDIYIISEGEELLIELKKYDKILTKNDLKHDINQALDYHTIVQSLGRRIDNQVYLVIFHYGDYFPVIRGNNPLLKNDLFVHIYFIYLGKKNPSDKRKEEVYELD